jgi:hypothetical protein
VRFGDVVVARREDVEDQPPAAHEQFARSSQCCEALFVRVQMQE